MISDDDVIDLWAEANKLAGIKHPHTFDELKEFAQLVAEKVREETMSSANRQWVKMSQTMLENEREACAKLCEEDKSKAGEWTAGSRPGAYFAKQIRARGNT